MTEFECPREQEVVDAVASGRWPAQCDDELRRHAAVCTICTDVAAVAVAMQEERDRAWRDAHVPPSGRVWWRAEMRARQEAARKAAQPITIVQGLAGACAAGLVIALVEIVWLQFSQSVDLVGSLKQFIGVGQLEIASLTSAMPQLGWQLAIAVAAWVILTPVALYFVLSEK